MAESASYQDSFRDPVDPPDLVTSEKLAVTDPLGLVKDSNMAGRGLDQLCGPQTTCRGTEVRCRPIRRSCRDGD
jgi:hypothetical protein